MLSFVPTYSVEGQEMFWRDWGRCGLKRKRATDEQPWDTTRTADAAS